MTSEPVTKEPGLRGGITAIAVLAILAVGADFVVSRHGHFAFEDVPGFYAALALAITLAAVLLSAAIGTLITRPEDYWDD